MITLNRLLDSLLLIKHSKLAYMADFVVYFLIVMLLIVYLVKQPVDLPAWAMGVYILLGCCSWSLIEYGLHRFVLHRYPPFLAWHGEHHRQPRALICTATVVSLGAIIITVYLPLYWLLTSAVASTFTLGLLIGYLAYAVTHHAIHHWKHPGSYWLRQRRQMHDLHHGSPHIYFGVTSNIWDRLLHTSAKRTQ